MRPVNGTGPHEIAINTSLVLVKRSGCQGAFVQALYSISLDFCQNITAVTNYFFNGGMRAGVG